MVVCTSYTDTHEIFLKEFFLKTFPFEEEVSLFAEKLPQKCRTGSLFDVGWRDQMIEKQIFINKCLSSFSKDEVLVFTDVDISFYGNIKTDLISSLGTQDICFMKDHNSDTTGRCGGFFITKPTDKMKTFFADVLKRLKSYTDTSVSFETSEQMTINALLGERQDIKWAYLPARYYTHGLYIHGIKNFSDDNQMGLWWENKTHEEKSSIFVPQDILVHHANWAHGIENKKELLEWVKAISNHNNNKPNAPPRRG